MKAPWWIFGTFLASTVLSIETLPFSPPETAEISQRSYEVLQILKRTNNCPVGYDPCTNLGNSNVCCESNAVCSRDAANNIACCPTGAKCTGSLTGTGTGTSTGTGTGTGTGTSTGTSFMFPGTADATTTTSATDATITSSTMPGAYPFIYVPTTFANSGICTSYYSLCQSAYTACTSQLGQAYGVTVAGGGAGVTVQGGVATSAVSVCSSLSQAACHGLNLGYCGTVSSNTNNASRAVSGRASSLQDMIFGMVVAMTGMFI